MRGDVYAAAEHVVLRLHHVALMNPDAQYKVFDSPNCFLDADRAAHGVIRAGETQQQAVAHFLEPLAAKLLHERLDDLLLRGEQLERCDLVALRELGEPDDVGEDNDGQAARMLWCIHGNCQLTVAAWPSA